MSSHYFRHESCRLCGEHELAFVLQLVPTAIADDYITFDRLNETQEIYPLDLSICKNCGNVQLLDVVHSEVLYEDYIYLTTSSPGLDDHFKGYAQAAIQRLNPDLNSLVVDIGSNDGTLLKKFKELGLKVLGVEPANSIARRANESGINTIQGFFSRDIAYKIINSLGKATIVTANNVIANVDELSDFVSGVRELLAPGGVFIFETGYLVDLIQNVVFDNIYHEHLSYFGVRPLEKFFKSNGLELIHVEQVSTKGGSLRGFVQLVGGTRSVSESVQQMVAFEKEIGLYEVQTFEMFDNKLQTVREKLRKLVESLKKQGRTIAGYGASPSVTTLMYYFGLGDSIKYLIDDNPIKQNRFSPGYHIPILSGQALYEQKPDYIIILPWRFGHMIVNKHQEYLQGGGHFIIPLPDIVII